MAKTDQQLSQAVHDAAKAFARALTEAGNAGLHITYEVKPTRWSSDGTNQISSDYFASVRVERVTVV